jgi:hypothetical protein
MRRRVPPILLVLLAALVLVPVVPGSAAPPPAHVTVVQAVPGATVTVTVDGRRIAADADVGDVLGPFDLAPGTHAIAFRGDGVTVSSTLTLKSGATSDIVLHLPAEVDGEPVVHSYAAPTGAIGPGKARVMLAHTATVAPADVQVDGQTVFTNIANGEFADADVPAGTIEVALLPSGTTSAPILGPLDVALDAGTLSMIYAYGNPRNGSMNVIAHTAALSPDGSVRPSRIDTGSAGLVTTPVTTFDADGDPSLPSSPVVLALVLAAAGVVGVRRHRAVRPTRPAR